MGSGPFPHQTWERGGGVRSGDGLVRPTRAGAAVFEKCLWVFAGLCTFLGHSQLLQLHVSVVEAAGVNPNDSGLPSATRVAAGR